MVVVEVFLGILSPLLDRVVRGPTVPPDRRHDRPAAGTLIKPPLPFPEVPMRSTLCLLLASVAVAAADPAPKVLYESDLAGPKAIEGFAFPDPAAWRIVDRDGTKVLEQHQNAKYKPPFRSPTNFCLVEGKKFGDFTMDVECEQTSKEYGHRDMVFVFGLQSPSQFYYAHVATKGDDHANQIFIVNEDARKKITSAGNAGNDWGKPGTWKKVRIERKVADGSIKVYFDDMTKPIMEATDKSFGAGHLGFGTFDDTCRVRKVTVRGTAAEDAPAPKFPESKK
jgi:hypothetical protein